MGGRPKAESGGWRPNSDLLFRTAGNAFHLAYRNRACYRRGKVRERMRAYLQVPGTFRFRISIQELTAGKSLASSGEVSLQLNPVKLRRAGWGVGEWIGGTGNGIPWSQEVGGILKSSIGPIEYEIAG